MGLPQNLIVRPVESRDVVVIASHRYFNVNESPSDKAFYTSWVEAAILKGNYLGLVAELDGVTVAGAGVAILDWGPARGNPNQLRGRIVKVFTDGPWRRKGISRQLLTQLLEDARNRGVASFCLGATDEAKALYKSFGFKDYGHEMVLK